MSGAEIPLIVFARAPTPGQTKTRLVPALGRDGAARLSAAFLDDVLARVARVPELRPELWCPTEEDAARFEQAHVQVGGDVGERMAHALSVALTRAPAALLIGSDLPTLPATHLRAAARALATHDVVLGPAHDGGFYLVGARASAPDLRPPIRWSTRHALADTRARLAHRAVALIRPWYDVDTPEDLRLLRAHLALRPSAAPRSAATLADFDRVRGA